MVSVQPLEHRAIRRLQRGATTISFLPTIDRSSRRSSSCATRASPLTRWSWCRASRAPSRWTRCRSQALVSGYRCAIVAAGLLRRFFPLNMTAAGTVQAAEVVVLGAGVAGLQAIATAKRLGAVVKAYDVRAAAAEEIRSMGAKSIDLDLDDPRGRRRLRPRDDRGPRAAAARAARAVHRRGRRADHHRRRARPPGAAAGDPRDGRGR